MSHTSRSIGELNADLFGTGEEDRDDARTIDPKAARKKAMDYLARREHSRDELIEKLERAGFDSATATESVERLAGEGLQDDARFIANFVQSRVNQGKGPVRIRAELRRRGADTALLEEVLAREDTDWCALARRVRIRKFGSDVPPDFPTRARQMQFLQYRGFERAHIEAAMAAAAPDGED